MFHCFSRRPVFKQRNFKFRLPITGRIIRYLRVASDCAKRPSLRSGARSKSDPSAADEYGMERIGENGTRSNASEVKLNKNLCVEQCQHRKDRVQQLPPIRNDAMRHSFQFYRERTSSDHMNSIILLPCSAY